MALPMWLLFELGILFSRVMLRNPSQASDEAEPLEGDRGGASGPAGGACPAGGLVIGSEIEGGDPFDQGRFRPLPPEEMEDELDAIEAAEAKSRHDRVAEKLRRVMDLREDDDQDGARRLLREVLQEGDEDQQRVARNILAQIDEP
jgi:sec-independent protein translocase protein TatC